MYALKILLNQSLTESSAGSIFNLVLVVSIYLALITGLLYWSLGRTNLFCNNLTSELIISLDDFSDISRSGFQDCFNSSKTSSPKPPL